MITLLDDGIIDEKPYSLRLDEHEPSSTGWPLFSFPCISLEALLLMGVMVYYWSTDDWTLR